MTTWVAARDTFPAGRRRWASKADVTSDDFQTVGIRLTRAAFTPADRAGRRRSRSIRETLATWFLPGRNPVGEHIAVASPDSMSPPTWMEIVGVVNEVQPPITTGASNLELGRSAFPRPRDYAMNVIARHPRSRRMGARAEAGTLCRGSGRRDLRSTTFESGIDAVVYPRRMAAGILSFAGVIGLALAAIGLYGVVSYSVAQRLRDIGIRATLAPVH